MPEPRQGVAIVVPFLDHLGGMERIALEMAQRFHDDGVWTVLHTCRHLRDDPALRRARTAVHLPVVSTAVLQRSPLLDLTWVLPGALRLAARRRAFRAVIAHQVATSGVLAALGTRGGGPRFAVVAHGSGAEGDGALLDRLPLRRVRAGLVNRASFVASPSAGSDRELVASGIRGELLRRVPNGCDTAAFGVPSGDERREARRRLGVTNDDLVVAFCGRLARGKRLGTLLRALGDPAGGATRLLVAGDGPERAGLERLAAELGLGERVAFLGALEDVRPVLRAADLFALPSASEGMSRALVEAMACGVAPVVSGIAANREVVTDGLDGVVVPEDDPVAWREAIRALGAEPGRRRGLAVAARGTVERRFRAEDVHRVYLDWFRSL
jgi:glycosyltransferase involved in cell wall biosynthesis